VDQAVEEMVQMPLLAALLAMPILAAVAAVVIIMAAVPAAAAMVLLVDLGSVSLDGAIKERRNYNDCTSGIRTDF